MHILLRSIEELIYTLVLWVMLFPKTYFQVLFHPSWVPVYIDEELEKDPESRFENYMSPIIFFIICSSPYFVIRYLLGSPAIVPLNVVPESSFQTDYITYLIGLLLFPLGYTIYAQVLFREPIGRTSTMGMLLPQCYILGVFWLIYVIKLSLDSLSPLNSLLDEAVTIIWILFIVNAERKYFKSYGYKGVVHAIGGFVLSMILVVISTGLASFLQTAKELVSH